MLSYVVYCRTERIERGGTCVPTVFAREKKTRAKKDTCVQWQFSWAKQKMETFRRKRSGPTGSCQGFSDYILLSSRVAAIQFLFCLLSGKLQGTPKLIKTPPAPPAPAACYIFRACVLRLRLRPALRSLRPPVAPLFLLPRCNRTISTHERITFLAYVSICTRHSILRAGGGRRPAPSSAWVSRWRRGSLSSRPPPSSCSKPTTRTSLTVPW